MHWTTPVRRYHEAVREVLRSVRRLISGFDREIEAVLFHGLGETKARELFYEGFVDEIEELRL